MEIGHTNRRIELDIIRGVAILLVVGYHSNPTPSFADSPPLIAFIAQILRTGGWIGVDLFFVLSGFLVGGLLFKEYRDFSNVDIPRFLIRRGFKIYPPFWFLTICSILLPLSGSFPPGKPVVCDLLYIQSYCPGIWVHSWSLAVEEHFYLILAMTVLLLVARRRSVDNPFRLFPVLVIGLAGLSLTFRLANDLQPFDWMRHYAASHLRIDSIAFGSLLAYYYHFHRPSFVAFSRKYRVSLLLVGLLLLAPPFVIPYADHAWMYTIGFVFYFLGGGMLLMVAVTGRINNNLITRTISYIGKQSYSIYLWHVSVVRFFIPLITEVGLIPPLSPSMKMAVYSISSIVLGILMALLVEGPFLRLREMAFPARSKLPPVNAAVTVQPAASSE